MDTVGKRTPEEVLQAVLDAKLKGRGGAWFPTGKKWSFIGKGHPRYIVPNSDEMEPGTFKDRVLVNANPHLVLEGIILAAYAIAAAEGLFFIRPSYEMDAQLIERELAVARDGRLPGEEHPGERFFLRHGGAPERRALYLRGGLGPGGGHHGEQAAPHEGSAHGGHRPVGQAHHRQQRRDPGLCAPHPAKRPGMVQGPVQKQGRRRHQAFCRLRPGQPPRLL